MRNTLLVVAAALLAVDAGARPLAVEDYYRIVAVQAPAMSPDGRWVAFIRSSIVEAENRRQGELWIVAADGSAPARRVSDPAVNASGPRWSPDGTLLAFSGRRRGAPASDDGGESIWFLRADRMDDAPLQIRGVEGTPIFSPDNKLIAFTKRIAKPKAPQYANDADRLINERFKGKAYEWLNYRFDQRGYLPDPRDPAATPPEELFIVSREGGEAQQLTRTTVNVSGVAWRPDSGALAFVANEFQRDEYTYARADLWTVTLDGTVKRLTNDGYDHNSPAWSPDGKSLVARRELGLSGVIASKQMHGAPTDLALFAADGGAPKNLTADWDLLPGPPAFSPDGRFVYFAAGIGGSDHLFRVAANPPRVEQVTTGERHLANFTPSARWDAMAYIAGDSAHPEELFVSGIDGRGEKKLTAFNDAFVKDIEAIAADRILYPSKDGTRIEGWVLKPRGYDPARAWPLILAMPVQQWYRADTVLHVKASVDPGTLVPRLHEVLRTLDSNVPLFDVRTIGEQLSIAVFTQRMVASLLGAFGALALLLATVGLYGVIAAVAAQRTPEIGMRMALGATRRDIIAMIVRQGLTLTLTGVAIGLIAALGATRLFKSLLVGVSATDAPSFAVTTILLVTVALAAAYLPARGAARIDPLQALRNE